jgi:predicted Zn-dependent peptidase
MSILNKLFCRADRNHAPVLLLLILFASEALAAETRQFSLQTAKGFPLKVLQDSEMPLVHAELYVFLDSSGQNYNSLLISQLAVMNVFSQELDTPSSGLLASLFRLGNDYQVEQNPEQVKISVNFLPDRLAGFTKVVKEIFSYQSFHLGKFNRSKEQYWLLLKKNRDWKREIAFLLAYQQIIGNFDFSQGVMLQELINGINLAQLRSFYLKTFRPDNSLLIIKGNVNPYIVLGLLEKDLPASAAPAPKKKKEDVRIHPGRKIFVLNQMGADYPMIYWFDVAPSASNLDYLSFFIGNYAVFGFPGGRIYQSERNQALLNGVKVSTEIYPLKSFTIFCNHLRMSYSDIENFLQSVDLERKKFTVRAIAKKEYLDALNYFLGRAQVETGFYTHGIQQVLDRFYAPAATSQALPRPSELFREVTYERVAQMMDDVMGYKNKTSVRERGIIVLIGNAGLIVNNLKNLKVDIVELQLD